MRVRGIGGLAALGLAALLCLPVVPASAQMETREGIALQNQILELQREIEALQQQRGGGAYPGYAAPAPYAQPNAPGGASSDIVASLLTRVDTLEAAVRELRGRVETLSNQLQQVSAQLGKRLDDLQFQMQNGAAAAGTTAPVAAPPSGTVPPPPVPRSGATAQSPAPAAPEAGKPTPELALRNGNAALAQHDYPAAERYAREVLANKLSPHAAEATYLLAQAQLGQKQYSQAAISFDDAYNRSKKGPYAQDSLLGLADALIAINEKRAACDTLAKLRAEFPSQRPDVRDRAAQDARRAGCR